MAGMRDPGPRDQAKRRRTRAVALIAAGIIVVALAGGGIAWFQMGNPAADSTSSDSTAPITTTPTASSDPTPSASSTPRPKTKSDSPPKLDPHYGAPIATAVKLHEDASLKSGIMAKVTSIKSVTSSGSLPGEFSGPAVEVTVTITNHSKKTVSLAPVAVNCYFGAEKTPAVPIMSGPNNTSFTGSVKPSHSASAAYIFKMAKKDQPSMTVTVAGIDGSKVVVFG